MSDNNNEEKEAHAIVAHNDDGESDTSSDLEYSSSGSSGYVSDSSSVSLTNSNTSSEGEALGPWYDIVLNALSRQLKGIHCTHGMHREDREGHLLILTDHSDRVTVVATSDNVDKAVDVVRSVFPTDGVDLDHAYPCSDHILSGRIAEHLLRAEEGRESPSPPSYPSSPPSSLSSILTEWVECPLVIARSAVLKSILYVENLPSS